MIKQISKASRDHAQRYQKFDIDFNFIIYKNSSLPPGLYFLLIFKNRRNLIANIKTVGWN